MAYMSQNIDLIYNSALIRHVINHGIEQISISTIIFVINCSIGVSYHLDPTTISKLSDFSNLSQEKFFDVT